MHLYLFRGKKSEENDFAKRKYNEAQWIYGYFVAETKQRFVSQGGQKTTVPYSPPRFPEFLYTTESYISLNIITMTGNIVEVLDNSVGQHIGLKDGKEREIFDNDYVLFEGILMRISHSSRHDTFVGTTQPYSTWGMFDGYKFFTFSSEYPPSSCTIIGNTTDTPELELQLKKRPQELNTNETTSTQSQL